MKTRLPSFALAALLALAGCDSANEADADVRSYRVRLGGTVGLTFTCALVETGEGGSRSFSEEGVVPDELGPYEAERLAAGCFYVTEGADELNRLELTLLVGVQAVATATATSQRTNVSVSHP